MTVRWTWAELSQKHLSVCDYTADFTPRLAAYPIHLGAITRRFQQTDRLLKPYQHPLSGYRHVLAWI
jgi:hypothetical protein